MALRSLALCAGVGGLDLGVKLARPDHRLVGAVERQAYCAAVLVARMAEAALDPAPIWDDLATFDGEPWNRSVDLITAGYPCQPDSLAGVRRGIDDERWLWHEVWRVICEVGPRLVFLENVPGHLSGTFRRVVGDLAAGGWRVEWDCVPAASVGAPHERDRLFVLASYANSERGRIQPVTESRSVGPTDAHHAGPRGIPNANERRRQAEWGAWLLDRQRQALGYDAHRCSGSGSAAEPDNGREPAVSTGSRESANDRRGHGRAEGSDRIAWPAPEPVFRRVDDGARHRLDRDWADRIHALGNAVVPQAAAQAWRVLEGRLRGR